MTVTLAGDTTVERANESGRRWKFKLKKKLPPGKYTLYSRAVNKAGARETTFSRKGREQEDLHRPQEAALSDASGLPRAPGRRA